MLSFENDYSRAAHPAVLEAVAEANNHLYPGYGSDELSDQAKAKIGLRVKMCVWLGVSRGLDLAFLNAD